MAAVARVEERDVLDPEEREVIEANCRAYDEIDKREELYEKKEELAG